MPVLQLLVGKVTDKVAAHESEEPCFVLRYRAAKKNVGLTFVAAWLPSLDHQHEWKYEPICLSGPGVGPQPVYGLRDVIEKSAVQGFYQDRLAFRVAGIAQSARMNERKM
jgi:hypothetical protein